MINYLSKSLALLLVIFNLTSCSSSPSSIPDQEISIGEKILNATPNKPDNLSFVTCLKCDLENENSGMIEFFKRPKTIEFNISSIFDIEGEVYYGFKYNLGQNHQAIVFGHDYLQGGIDFYLVIWNNKRKEFVSEPQIISGTRGDGGEYGYIESTIIDINNDDDVLDLVTNYYTVYTNSETLELENELLEISIFNEGKFEKAHGTKEQIQLYKTQSFTLPERKSNDELSEDAPEYCFGMAYPTGNKRTSITEYIRFRDVGGQISGYGAGYTEGEPYRSFEFKATYTNPTTLKVEAIYSPEGRPSFTSSEIWTVNLEKSILNLDNNIPEDMRIVGDGKFHSIDCTTFPKWAKDLIESHNDRTKLTH